MKLIDTANGAVKVERGLEWSWSDVHLEFYGLFKYWLINITFYGRTDKGSGWSDDDDCPVIPNYVYVCVCIYITYSLQGAQSLRS